MTTFKWPDDPADALKLPNTNVYIDGSGSMARNLTRRLSAFKYAVAWASEERGGFQRLYAYNMMGVANHHEVGFGQFPHGSDGTYFMLNHAEEQKRRFVVITDDPGQLANELAKRQHRLGGWALVIVGGMGGDFSSISDPPSAVYSLPEPNPLREVKQLAPTSAAKLADSMARATRRTMESMAASKGRPLTTEYKLDPGISPAISEAHNDPELARSYMETLAEALMTDPHLSLERSRRPHAHELAEQIMEAKRKRKREDAVVSLKELTGIYASYHVYERAFLDFETPENTAHLSRLWRSLKPVHDFVKEALGE